ncbi:MAG: MotA/TolQ/ExbB proton channel family protein [Bacteroidota bacterium]|nr:MotA/TolQ/ExbB proton channel family protein [Bacteroidota bacterium]
MVRFFAEGNYWFMGTLSVLFLVILILSVMAGKLAINPTAGRIKKIDKLSGYIKSLALFTLVFGIFGQILGLVDVFDYLAHKDPQVATSILAKGIKITCWSTIYGIIIYLVSILITLGLKFRVNSVK